jgi:hypothetical protein
MAKPRQRDLGHNIIEERAKHDKQVADAEAARELAKKAAEVPLRDAPGDDPVALHLAAVQKRKNHFP